jgi:hypothetical protein
LLCVIQLLDLEYLDDTYKLRAHIAAAAAYNASSHVKSGSKRIPKPTRRIKIGKSKKGRATCRLSRKCMR